MITVIFKKSLPWVLSNAFAVSSSCSNTASTRRVTACFFSPSPSARDLALEKLMETGASGLCSVASCLEGLLRSRDGLSGSLTVLQKWLSLLLLWVPVLSSCLP